MATERQQIIAYYENIISQLEADRTRLITENHKMRLSLELIDGAWYRSGKMTLDQAVNIARVGLGRETDGLKVRPI